MFINKLLTNLLNVVAITHKWGKRIAKPCTVINIKYLPELGSLEVALYGATAIQNMQKKKIDESIIRFNCKTNFKIIIIKLQKLIINHKMVQLSKL